MKKMGLIALFGFSFLVLSVARAEDALPTEYTDRDPAATAPLPQANTTKIYPGSADEDDLQVQTHLPEAGLKTDARSLQRGVYKTLYNQELKDEGRDAVEE